MCYVSSVFMVFILVVNLYTAMKQQVANMATSDFCGKVWDCFGTFRRIIKYSPPIHISKEIQLLNDSFIGADTC